MTNQEKLQQLFEAALKAPAVDVIKPTRAFPVAAAPVAAPAEAAPAVFEAPAAEAETPAKPDLVQPMENAGLDEESSKELGVMLDEQMRRKSRKRRREALVTLGVLSGLTGGGFGWFVHSPERVTAFKDAMHDIRSVGDIRGMVDKYRKSLDKIAARGKDVDIATESMGVSSDLTGEKDVNMDAEMRQMMVGEGKTTGERNRMLQQKLGTVAKGLEKKTGVTLADTTTPAVVETSLPPVRKGF